VTSRNRRMFLLYLKWGTLVGGAVSPKEFASWTTHSSSTAFVCDFTSENVTEDIKRKRTRTHTHTRARAREEELRHLPSHPRTFYGCGRGGAERRREWERRSGAEGVAAASVGGRGWPVTSRKMQQGAAAMQGDEAKLGGTGPVGLRQPSAICCEFRAASRGIAINSRFSLVERRSPCLVQHAPSECSNTRWCCYANRAEEIESANRGATNRVWSVRR